jgi:hypothetical protein
VLGAAEPDHFGPWLGLIGGAGLAINELFTAEGECTQRQHEDTVRFHEERLSRYAAYMSEELRGASRKS